MPTTDPIESREIERHKREFEQSTERARRYFATGAIVIGVAMIVLLLLALYHFQAWAV